MALIFTTPTGRIVQGDPYKMTQKTDSKTKALKVKPDGTPMMSSYIALAIPKNDPDWPAFKAMCDEQAKLAWPLDHIRAHRDFATKIEDGDSTEPNKTGKRNCDREGFAGHWIVKLSSGYAPTVNVWLTAAQANEHGRVPPGKQPIDGWYASSGGEVVTGDYVKVQGSIDSNKSSESPGMYMNYNQCALQRKGEAIVSGMDANEAFGTAPPPAAAGNAAPAATSTPPAATTPSSPTAGAGSYTGFMDAAPPPPADTTPPPPEGPQMTAKAQGKPYESFIAAGWSDTQLRQHGYIA